MHPARRSAFQELGLTSDEQGSIQLDCIWGGGRVAKCVARMITTCGSNISRCSAIGVIPTVRQGASRNSGGNVRLAPQCP
jgi:hypothetical protein